MKAFGKLKSMLAVLLVFIIAFSALSINILATQRTAGAAGYTGGVTLVDTAKLKSSVKYGEKVSVPAGIGSKFSVTAPNGVLIADGKTANFDFFATQAGNYAVTYISNTDDDVKYSFNIFCSVEEECFIYIEHNGADIPTFVEKNTEFTLPSAYLAYVDEEGELQKVDGADIVISDGKKNDLTAGTYKPENSGNLFITYSARLPYTDTDDNNAVKGGSKYYSQTFNVRVQDEFTDNLAPTLNVVNVPTDINIYKKVTLPKATATDDFDENIKITVTVTDPDAELVRFVTPDANGFAKAYDEAAYKALMPVEFDNNYVTSFYPVKSGTYKVTYVATDDAKKTSSEHTFTMTSSDKSAPVFDSIDDFQIPTKWGLSVKKANPANLTDKNGVAVNPPEIKFPNPVVIDNNGNDNLTVYFKIVDSNKNKTVIEFSNILAAKDESATQYVGSDTGYGTAGTTYDFYKGKSFSFDFNLYPDAEPGDYVVTYRARDAAGNTASKTYTITLQDDFVDIDPPTTAELETPEFIAIGRDESFTVPLAVAADKNSVSTRLNVVYDIVNGNGDSITVKGGEEAEIKYLDDNDHSAGYYFVFEDDEDIDDLLLVGELEFRLTVYDNVGNLRRNSNDQTVDENYLGVCKNIIKIIDASATTSFNYVDTDIVNTIDAMTVGGKQDWAQGATMGKNSIGGFSITNIDPDYRYYTGFEVTVRDSDDSILNLELETFSILDNVANPTQATIIVRDITFTPTISGIHTVSVRVFDITGNSVVTVYKLDIIPVTSGNTQTSSAALPKEGAINTSFTLPNKVISDIQGAPGLNYYVLRKIEGKRFSLMGNEFTALTTGTYYLADGYVSDDPTKPYEDFVQNSDGYVFSATDAESIVLDIQGVMPTYWAKYDKNAQLVNGVNPTVVQLPSVIAYSANGNASVEVLVKYSKSGATVNTEYSDTENTYSFQALNDGLYTITYTASLNDRDPLVKTFNINIGNVIGPSFRVVETPNTRQTVGDSFKFSVVELLGTSHKIEDVTVTKKLIDPAKEVVSEATISGKGSSYAEKQYNDKDNLPSFTKSGTYEVLYELEDNLGNKTTLKYTVQVSAKSSGGNFSMTVLSTVLIIVAVVLLLGVIVYVFRFRKVKK